MTIKKSLNFSKVYAKNSSKYSLLNNYYFQRKALLDEIDWQKIKIGQIGECLIVGESSNSIQLYSI